MLFDKVLLQTLTTNIWQQLQQHMQMLRQRLFSFSWTLAYLITG